MAHKNFSQSIVYGLANECRLYRVSWRQNNLLAVQITPLLFPSPPMETGIVLRAHFSSGEILPVKWIRIGTFSGRKYNELYVNVFAYLCFVGNTLLGNCESLCWKDFKLSKEQFLERGFEASFCRILIYPKNNNVYTVDTCLSQFKFLLSNSE